MTKANAQSPAHDQDRLLQLLDSSREGVIALDRTLTVAYCNTTACTILGLTREQLLGQAIGQTALGNANDRIHQDLLRVLSDAATLEQRVFVDSVHKWLELRAIPLGTGVAVHFSDATRLVCAEQAASRLQQLFEHREQLFHVVMQNVDQAMGVLSVDGAQIYYISPGYEKLFGRSAQSLYEDANSWLEVIIDEDRQRVAQQVQIASAGPPGVPTTLEFRIR